MTQHMQHITLASRPNGTAVAENFRLQTAPIPAPEDGEILVKVHYLSLDPYMRGRMDDAKSYADPVAIGKTMTAGAVGEVISSNDPAFAVGDFAYGPFGWSTHGVAAAQLCRQVDPDAAPISTSLGVLGMPGFTGWFGLMEYGKPKAGETLVVAAATGAVGSMVGQVAKTLGLRVIGIAGGAEKCKTAVEQFGFDACLDHRAYKTASELRQALAKECPNGIDIYFENVGGKVMEAVIPLMNPFGRIPICGMIGYYNPENVATPSLTLPALWRTLLVKFISVNGFIIFNHWDAYPTFLKEMTPKVASGEVRYLEDIKHGIQNAPDAFIGLLQGQNMGKQIVKVI